MPRLTNRQMSERTTEPVVPTEIMGAPIAGLPTSALLFWLEHYTQPSRMRVALLAECDRRPIAVRR